MFSKILPEDIIAMVERFKRNNRFSFFSEVINPDARAYQALVSSREYRDLVNGYFTYRGDGWTRGSSYKARVDMARGDIASIEADSEVRYDTTIARKLAEIHEAHCQEQPGPFCNEIASMLKTFNEFITDDAERYIMADMNNGDWACGGGVASRYDVTPVTERSRFTPG